MVKSFEFHVHPRRHHRLDATCCLYLRRRESAPHSRRHDHLHILLLVIRPNTLLTAPTFYCSVIRFASLSTPLTFPFALVLAFSHFFFPIGLVVESHCCFRLELPTIFSQKAFQFITIDYFPAHKILVA